MVVPAEKLDLICTLLWSRVFYQPFSKQSIKPPKKKIMENGSNSETQVIDKIDSAVIQKLTHFSPDFIYISIF